MSLKSRRQKLITEILRDRVVETQEELAELLRQEGISVTQATVSRDIKEMHLIKIPNGDGRYRYALPEEGVPGGFGEHLLRLLRECVVRTDWSENIVVIHTLPATAAGVAEALDSLDAEEVIGTLAGERTVFVVVRPKEAVPRFLGRLRQLTR